MNWKKLLIGLSYIDRKYIEESEQDMPVRNAITTTINQNKAQLKCLSTKKIWLIAGRDCADSATGWMCDYICQMVFWIGRLVSSQQHDPSTG